MSNSTASFSRSARVISYVAVSASFGIIGPSYSGVSVLDTRIEGLLVSGRSLAGIATTVAFPELGLTVDLGECTRAALRTPVIALTHGHADHLGGLPMYLGIRRLYGMADPLIVTPPDTVDGVRKFIDSLGALQGRPFDARVLPAPGPGETLDLENDIFLRTFAVNHYPDEDGDGKACGYVACRRVRHLLPEYIGLPGATIAELRQKRPDIVREEQIPLVAVSGDTTPGWIERADAQVLSARVLFQECTFLGQGRTTEAARKGMHSHIDDLKEVLNRVKSRAIVLYHFSQFYQSDEVGTILRAVLSPDQMARIHLFDMGERL